MDKVNEFFNKYKSIFIGVFLAFIIGMTSVFLFTIMFSIIKKEVFDSEPIKVKIQCEDIVYSVNKENISEDNFLYSDYDSNNKFEVHQMKGCTLYDKN